MRRIEKHRQTVLAITFGTGFAGLVYEVVWQRYLGNMLGSEAKSTAFVLAVFLGGLSLGYRLFGQLSARVSQDRLVRAAGLLEIGIGLWALLFPVLYGALWHALGVLSPSHALSGLWDIATAVILVGVPTTLMGGTLPLLTQALSPDVEGATGVHAAVYAWNTGGAFLGCLAGGFLLLPQLGLPGSCYATGALNLAAGAGLLALSRAWPSARTRAAAAGPPRARADALLLPSALAFLAGFVSLTLQDIAIRLVAISVGASDYAFCTIVSIYVLLIAVGASRLAGRAPGGLTRNQHLVTAGLFFIAVTVPVWPYCVHLARTLFGATGRDFCLYHLSLLVLFGALLGLAVGAMGRTMPLLFHVSKGRFERLGHNVGRLYAWNTAGCVTGALVGGYLLLTLIDMDRVVQLCILLALGTALLAAVVEKTRGLRTARRLLPYAGVALLALALPRWSAEWLAVGLFRVREARPASYQGPFAFYREFIGPMKLLYRRDGPDASVAVITDSKDRSLIVNGKSDGNTGGDRATMVLAAHLPMLFKTGAPAKDIGLIGYGLGLSAGSFSLYPEVGRIDSMEISPLVREVAPMFDFANHEASHSPKLHWLMGDAYRYLSSTEEHYGAIMSEPSNPWVTGVERLFSRDFYELVRRRLDRGGVYAQWLQAYEISLDTIAMVVHTFGRSFPSIRAFALGGAHDLVLLGSDGATEPDIARMRALLANPAIREDLARVGVRDLEDLAALELPLEPGEFRNFQVHTLDAPKLAAAAGRDLFAGVPPELAALFAHPYAKPWVQKAERRSLAVALLAAAGSGRIDELRRLARASCHRESVGFFKGWESSSRLCRETLAALAVAGAVAPDEAFSPELKASLSGLAAPAGASSSRPASTIAEARGAINLYARFDSGVLPLDARALERRAAVCFVSTEERALQCRAQLVEALARSGHGARAEAVLGGLKNTGVPAPVLERLAGLVTEGKLSEGL